MLSSKKLSPAKIQSFRRLIWNFYSEHRRSFVWRKITDPYAIVVSEIMLQQTQTDRVAKKFPDFLTLFPTFEALSTAPVSKILQAWQGLGYNRRALALYKIAQRVTNEFKGKLPNNPTLLETFPGIGPHTAGSICAFAFNTPTIFIETNVRTVFLYHFFQTQEKIHDREILPLVRQTLDTTKPREWYYALMDYGVYLKKTYKNPSRRSIHHTKQSKFAGSDRQLRGALLRFFLANAGVTSTKIAEVFSTYAKDRLQRIVEDLVRENFIQKNSDTFTLV